jgi:hypothetical protein
MISNEKARFPSKKHHLSGKIYSIEQRIFYSWSFLPNIVSQGLFGGKYMNKLFPLGN